MGKELNFFRIKEEAKSFFGFLRSRFSFVVSCFALAVSGVALVNAEFYSEAWKEWTKVFCASLLATVFAFIFSSFEGNGRFFKKFKPYFSYFAAAAASLAGYFLRSGGGCFECGEMYFSGVLFCSVVFCVLFLHPKEKSAYFAILVKGLFFGAFLTFVLYGGFVFSLFAIDSLLIKITHFDKYVFALASLCFSLFFIPYYAYYIFTKRGEGTSGKAFRYVVLYALFPIFLVFTAILYLYFVKILVLRDMPKGLINWFVSCTLSLYFFFYFALFEYKEAAALRFFYRFAHFFLIPLVACQILAYSIRLRYYGFTISRAASLYFIILTVIFLILAVFWNLKKEKILHREILLLFAAFSLFASISPFNILSLAKKSQLSRLEGILNKYGFFEGKEESLQKEASDEDLEKLKSAFDWFRKTSYVKKPKWFTDKTGGKNLSFKEFFGFDAERKNILRMRKYASYQDEFIDISEYSAFKPFSIYGSEEPHCTIEESDVSFFLLSLKEEDSLQVYCADGGICIYFTSVDFSFDKEKKIFSYYDLEGFYLKK